MNLVSEMAPWLSTSTIKLLLMDPPPVFLISLSVRQRKMKLLFLISQAFMMRVSILCIWPKAAKGSEKPYCLYWPFPS